MGAALRRSLIRPRGEVSIRDEGAHDIRWSEVSWRDVLVDTPRVGALCPYGDDTQPIR